MPSLKIVEYRNVVFSNIYGNNLYHLPTADFNLRVLQIKQ